MDFRNQIIGKFIRTYESGGTPNPCIDCNRYMKFDKLLRFPDERGLEYVATGHYALIEYDEVSGRYLLKKALDDSKDQSYVLYMLTQNQLSHIQFPLGGKMKKEVTVGILQRLEARQSGHLLRSERGLCQVYGTVYRKTLPGRSVS